jgi:hypothetical protein
MNGSGASLFTFEELSALDFSMAVVLFGLFKQMAQMVHTRRGA